MIFLKEHDIVCREGQVRLPMLRQPGTGRSGEKADMGGILDVVPVRKRFLLWNQLGHETEDPAGGEKRPKALQFEAGTMEMLDHFGGRDEIIGLIQD